MKRSLTNSAIALVMALGAASPALAAESPECTAARNSLITFIRHGTWWVDAPEEAARLAISGIDTTSRECHWPEAKTLKVAMAIKHAIANKVQHANARRAAQQQQQMQQQQREPVICFSDPEGLATICP